MCACKKNDKYQVWQSCGRKFPHRPYISPNERWWKCLKDFGWTSAQDSALRGSCPSKLSSVTILYSFQQNLPKPSQVCVTNRLPLLGSSSILVDVILDDKYLVEKKYCTFLDTHRNIKFLSGGKSCVQSLGVDPVRIRCCHHHRLNFWVFEFWVFVRWKVSCPKSWCVSRVLILRELGVVTSTDWVIKLTPQSQNREQQDNFVSTGAPLSR